MRAGARVVFASGLGLVLLAAAIVLSQSPETLARANMVRPLPLLLSSVPGAGSACQADETLPARTTAIAVSLKASAGPRVAAVVLSGKTIVTHGESASGWVGKLVTIPVIPLGQTVHNATVCVRFAGANERVSFLGARKPRGDATTAEAGALPGRMTIEYLRRGSASWWSLLLPVARRMGLGRAWSGAWVAVLVAVLMATGIALASWLILRAPT